MRKKLREFIEDCLQEHNDMDGLADDESLFISGRLSSLSMTRLVVYLEETFGIDFAQAGFDIEQIDSIAEIESFIGEAKSVGKERFV
jgi:acyl carrier protein